MPRTIANQLLRRLAASKPTTTPTNARQFSTSLSTSSGRTTTISQIDGSKSQAAAFQAKQKEFRDQLNQSKQKADSQSSSTTALAASSASAAASHVASNLGIVSESNDVSDAGEAKTASSSQSKTNEERGVKGALNNIIYGTKEGREMEADIERSFSQALARGKYVHSIVFHEVKPDKVDEYVKLVGDWYPKVASDPNNHVHLVGSWRIEVGDCDTFVHIWEYEKYKGYHKSLNTIQSTAGFEEFDHKMKPLIKSKKTSLMQEFSFWPTTPPRKLGGVFELRSYQLHPGKLLEWEQQWRKGLEARRDVMEGVGAWFVQVGDLNTVHFLWQFADLEERKNNREKSWEKEGWADTVHKTVPLIQNMKSSVMVPMPWSPVA